MSIKEKRYRKIIVALIILVILIGLLFPRLGLWLVAEDDIVESDIIVVLMGSVSDRILEAVDIYDGGFTEEIVMVNSHMSGYDDLLERGVRIPGDAQLSKYAANSLGVADDNILILDGQAQSTQDEAIVVREYLRDKEDIYKGFRCFGPRYYCKI